jgi:hypothetical protein
MPECHLFLRDKGINMYLGEIYPIEGQDGKLRYPCPAGGCSSMGSTQIATLTRHLNAEHASLNLWAGSVLSPNEEPYMLSLPLEAT